MSEVTEEDQNVGEGPTSGQDGKQPGLDDSVSLIVLVFEFISLRSIKNK